MTPTVHASPNHDNRPDGVSVDTLVVHYTGMPSVDAALQRLCDPAAGVSAHYLIDEDGSVHALVDEVRRAWHAGVASWRGHTDINARSIGIELVNPGHEWGYRPFPEAQMTALIGLAHDIVSRHAVPARNVVGHSDVAPTRKQDPGELFDWRRLAMAGIGFWPADDVGNGLFSHDETGRLLSEIGYETGNLGATLRAFQRRFRPSRVDGAADEETCRRIAAVHTLCIDAD